MASGVSKCHSCGMVFAPDEDLLPQRDESVQEKIVSVTPVPSVFSPFPERGFTQETCRRYSVSVRDGTAQYPIYDVNGNHIANKFRRPGKVFSVEGKTGGAGLFGRHAFPAGSAKFVTVTEGQDDALSVFQMTGNRYPAVSVHSASTAEADIRRDFEYLNSFEHIVLCFDSDDAGQRALKACANIGFPLGKVKILSLREFKDANDYLLQKKADLFTKEWWQAPAHKPDGLKLGSEMWDEIVSRKESFTVDYPFEGLNKKTFGLRLSELVVITADTGVGKTSLLKHIEYLLLTDERVKENNYGVGFLHLEEPNGDTALGLLSIHDSLPYHLPTTVRDEKTLREAFDTVLNNDRTILWDHFGSNSVDAVLDKIRHMVALGCRYIVLDHLSIVVSDQSGDERKQLDEITTKIKTLTMELDIAVIAVIHTNRQGQIRGTAGVEQLANIVFRISRNKTEPDEWRRNITSITVEKNRFCGYTGPAGHLWFNPDTGRLCELTEEEAATFESGSSIRMEERF